MRHARFDHLLAGAAVALALAVTGYAPLASAQSKNAVEATMPAADTPTSTDSAPAATNSVPAREASDALASSVASAAKPEPAVPQGDAAVADKLREMTGGKFDRILGGKRDRGAIEPFYADRNFAPLWISDGGFSPRAKAAAAYLAGIAADGLDPSDYPLPQVKPGADPDALAEAELRFTDSIVTYARHAQTGRVHFSRVASDIQYDPVKPEPADVLAKLAAAPDVGETLNGYNPPQPGYQALKAKLAEARNRGGDGGRARIASGPILRYGKDKKGNEMLVDDPRVPLLRERLDVSGDRSSTTYDSGMADAVAAFQKSNGLRPNGQLNAETVDTINGPRRDRDADVIIANMERWRWIPRDLGRIYVMVNIPDYTLRVVRDNKLVWTTRVVVGKPNLATPMIAAEMKFITVNPTWNVPPSIIQN
jgi:murein L,D-transpeptidase YcbB/YkuD